MHRLVQDLFPICRSITGDGMRKSLALLSDVVPIPQQEVPTGTKVFDWTVPKEWNIRSAWVADTAGKHWIDFAESNLHVVNYSAPVQERMPLSRLRAHLHTLPESPDLIPYRTSYYAEDWGFCLAQRTLDQLPDGDYDIHIDSTLEAGSLTYGELVLPGDSPNEILLSIHSCHPSLANDNLSGMVVGAHLANILAGQHRRHTFRFLFIPGTIGSITWLALHEQQAARIRHGLVLSCLGDPGPVTYKRSRRGEADVDRAAAHVLRNGGDRALSDFIPYGYDERQYCSPGFNLPVGCLTRTPNGKYPEYHTSADNTSFVAAEYLEDSLNNALAIIEILEHNDTYLNLNPKCEPQLGKRGLYANKGGTTPRDAQMAMLWVLNFSDGYHSLLEIAKRSGMDFSIVRSAATALETSGLLSRVSKPATKAPRGMVSDPIDPAFDSRSTLESPHLMTSK
jgi:aminopeptidase-like protein